MGALLGSSWKAVINSLGNYGIAHLLEKPTIFIACAESGLQGRAKAGVPYPERVSLVSLKGGIIEA